MKTVKLSISNDAKTDDYIRVFSSIYRMAFNRCQDGLSNKEIRNYLKSRFNVNSWLVESARAEAYNLYLSCGQKSVLFGGKYNLVQFLKGNITKEEFKKNRSIALCSIGDISRLQMLFGNFLHPSSPVICKHEACTISSELIAE